jgi:hypothetical protein
MYLSTLPFADCHDRANDFMCQVIWGRWWRKAAVSVTAERLATLRRAVDDYAAALESDPPRDFAAASKEALSRVEKR